MAVCVCGETDGERGGGGGRGEGGGQLFVVVVVVGRVSRRIEF